MRSYISKGLTNQNIEAWDKKYYESLIQPQKEQWKKKLDEGINPFQLIDYGNLKSFALNNRSFFEKDFGNQRNTLPTVFGQIYEARNMICHFEVFDNDKADKAYLHMIYIAVNLEMKELENDLRKLKNNFFNPITKTPEISIPKPINMKSQENSNNNEIIEYSAARLTFKRDLIEPLGDEDYFIVNVSNDNSSYKMKKTEFYETFNNVTKTSSYKNLGIYSYQQTPKKALNYLK